MEQRPDLLDYVVFFETEPDWIHPEGWYYGARFTTHRGADKIVVIIAPDEMEFSVQWWQDSQLRVRFSSVSVNGWTLEAAESKELLRVSFNDERVKFCELQLKPHVRVEWAMTW